MNIEFFVVLCEGRVVDMSAWFSLFANEDFVVAMHD